MSSVATVLTIVFSVIFTPFLIFFCGIVILAALGRTLGVRRQYVKLLLRVFEYGRISIEKNTRRRNSEFEHEIHETDCENEEQEPTPKDDLDYKNTEMTNSINGYVNNEPTVITREDFILLPEPTINNNTKNDVIEEEEENEPNETKENRKKKGEFELSDVLDYIKTGVEAIIEDQVTSRFEAQELKSWNLLTRTNRRYEFINWKITVIWFIGFWIRYAFLLPLRILICFFGVSWALSWTFCLSVWPDGELKRRVSEIASLITFRVFSLCVSGVINTHNTQWKPKKGGVCVANHTTPADAVILSTESAFSMVLWLTICTAAVGYVPRGPFKIRLNERVSKMCFQVLSSALSTVITYHNEENKPKNSSICVANHTSPIDCLVVACDNCYSLIGQRHGGFLGVLQRALARASPHIWFERDEVKDREAVANRIRKHVSNPNNPPILIFPEGTCINNTSVMQFKKGSFEVDSVIYPVAIKYDPRFGDAFWNSSKYSMMQYLYMMMSSWAIVCDVWYLPPMTRKSDETAVEFANRVKRAIAEQGGLVDLMWDGQLKRMKPKKEWKERHQEEFSRKLKAE